MSESSEVSRLRSPPFPSIPLQKAIERADQLYRQERDHLAPLASAARAWGMSPTSSSPIQTVGALKQYGLVEDDGAGQTRKVRLTKDALRILLDKEPGSRERQDAIQRCFLCPKIYNELWAKWAAELPSEQTMINHLVLERRLANLAPFSDQGAVELLGNYRSSMAFAAPQEVHSEYSPSQLADEDMSMQTEVAPALAKTQVDGPVSQRPISERPTPQAPLNPSERVVFVEEGIRGQHVKLVVSGDLDEITLDALTNYIERQKRRLKLSNMN